MTIQNLFELINIDKFTEFFPTKHQSSLEKINSLVRLSFYICISLSVYHNNIKYMYIFIFILCLYLVIINNNYPDIQIEKLEDNIFMSKSKNCVKPTLGNPFMNPTMKDYMNLDKEGNIIDRNEACDPNDPIIKKQIDKLFNNNLYKDVSDVFGKMNSQRQFYTIAGSTIPNDRDSFQKWLYNSSSSCKEDQNNCIKYEDLRSNRFIYPDPTVNPTNTKRFDKF
jgi:hypothetical protein